MRGKHVYCHSVQLLSAPCYAGKCSVIRISCRASSSLSRSNHVRILEVGPRDGLQNIQGIVPTATKLDLIRRLLSMGLKHIETTSFASPKWTPQLADNHQVLSETQRLTAGQDVALPVLTPNMKGLSGALKSKAQEVVVFVAASEGFSQKNTNCSIQEGLARAEEVTRAALNKGLRVRGVISCVVSCPYDGPTDPIKVLELARKLLAVGCYEIGLGDTVGTGTASDVERILRILLQEIPAHQLAGHFHDTYGQAVANVLKAYDMGLRAFDSSIAGLGGCPYAKGAKGNLATEDLVYTFEKAGIKTGLDLEKLAETGDWISRTLKIPNSSRAGSAIVAGSNAASVSISKSKTPDSQVEAPIWKEAVSRDGEYRISRAGTALKVTLMRPKNGNALTSSMVENLTAFFRSVAADRSVFHILLEAEGKFFCTGMDLSSTGSSASNDPEEKSRYYGMVKGLFDAIQEAPQTTIAVVAGSCYGGGVGLAFACDIRLVSSSAKFTMTEIKLGLTPAIISKFLVREWGPAFLREAMLTGREVDASELHRIGAVKIMADSSEQQVNDYLTRLSKSAPFAGQRCKELINLGYTKPASQQLDEEIADVFAHMMEPGSEGEYGLEQFRKKNKQIDWVKFWSAKQTA